jgi:hypothetical protein
MRYSMLLVVILLSVYSWHSASAQARQVMKYSVVFSDSSDTHFRDEEIPWETQQVSYSRQTALITPFLDAEKEATTSYPSARSSAASGAYWPPIV